MEKKVRNRDFSENNSSGREQDYNRQDSQWNERSSESCQGSLYLHQELRQGNQAAITGFWCGITSLVVFAGLLTDSGAIILLCTLLGLCASVMGIVFSLLGFRALSHRITALIGLILSILTLIIYLLLIVLAIIFAITPQSPQ